MFKALKDLLNRPDADDSPEESFKLAAAVLMVEVLAADSVVDQREIDHIHTILKNHFDIASDAIEPLFDQAQRRAERSIDLHDFTREICQHYDNDQRVQLLVLLWEVALIDGHLDHHERHVIRKVAGLLHLTDRQVIQAKERAQQSVDI